MATTTRKMFSGEVGNGETQYVNLEIKNGTIGAQLAWLDATSAATVTLELSSYSAAEAPTDEAGEAWHWEPSGVSVTGPTGAAAGSSVINVENVRVRRARLKVVASADCVLEVVQ